MGRIAYHTFTIQLPDYATVLALDKELLAWRDSLPTFLAMVNPDTSLDASHPYLFVQRHLLSCEWYYTRITLNRPYLLRRKPQDGRYAYSRNAAIESATADLLSRRAFMMEKGDLIINSGGYRVLNSYMVLGVTIKLDPDSPQADELRHLLNVVSGRARDDQNRMSEPIVKEELAIVEFLTAKSTYKPNTAAANGNANGQSRSAEGSDENTPVDLLLGLAKTNTGRRAAEEERRQLRLQQRREQEEQRQAVRRTLSSNSSTNSSNPVSSSPWGYVAPQMPGIDVHQPFGSQAQQGGPRLPRPLQPPKRDELEGAVVWASSSSDNPFAFQENNASPSFTTSGTGGIMPSPHNTFAGVTGVGNVASVGSVGSSGLGTMSPYQDMTLPLPNADEQLASLAAGTGAADALFSAPTEFGAANVGSFDFSNLGVPQQGMDLAFNPFAIQQTGDEA
jgi:hypothetical protein